MKTKHHLLSTAIICTASLFSVNLAYGYHPVSPYAYTLNNPVRYVDPKGEDVWEYDANGSIINRIKDKTQDAFHMVHQVDGKWQRVAEDNTSISFEYGTVKNVIETRVTDGAGNSYNITLFDIKGDENGQRLFEHMSNNPNSIEWSHSKVGTENSGHNMVGTSHQVNTDASGGYVQAMGYTHSHNHPNSTTGSPSSADIDFSASIKGVPTYIYSGYERGKPAYQNYNSGGVSMNLVPKVVNGKIEFQNIIKQPIPR